MSVPKTKPTEVSAESHIAAIANEEQRNDAQSLVVLMRKVTKQEPRMWGPSIVGFGSYHYKYASGHEGDSALAGFAARGRELVVYIAAGFEGEVDDLHRAWRSTKAILLSDPESKPWGLHEFTAADPDGNRFRVFYDFATPERETRHLK